MLLLNIWFLGNYPQERLFLPLKLKSFIQVFSLLPLIGKLKVTFQEREREFSQEFSPLMENRGITYQSHCHKNKTNGCMYCQYIKYRSIVICGTIWLICCVCGGKTNKMHVEGTAKYQYKMMCQQSEWQSKQRGHTRTAGARGTKEEKWYTMILWKFSIINQLSQVVKVSLFLFLKVLKQNFKQIL